MFEVRNAVNLMGTANEIQIVLVQKLLNDIRAEREGDTAVILTPGFCVLVRIRPQQVAQHTCKHGDKAGWKKMPNVSVRGLREMKFEMPAKQMSKTSRKFS